jgi:hypothetical protein
MLMILQRISIWFHTLRRFDPPYVLWTDHLQFSDLSRIRCISPWLYLEYLTGGTHQYSDSCDRGSLRMRCY